MFGHLDVNSDGKLSSQELFDLRNDEVSFLSFFLMKIFNKFVHLE
jgi:hypothetical protein